MCSWIRLTFVAFVATLLLSSVGLAKVNTSCPSLERPM